MLSITTYTDNLYKSAPVFIHLHVKVKFLDKEEEHIIEYNDAMAKFNFNESEEIVLKNALNGDGSFNFFDCSDDEGLHDRDEDSKTGKYKEYNYSHIQIGVKNNLVVIKSSWKNKEINSCIDVTQCNKDELYDLIIDLIETVCNCKNGIYNKYMKAMMEVEGDY